MKPLTLPEWGLIHEALEDLLLKAQNPEPIENLLKKLENLVDFNS